MNRTEIEPIRTHSDYRRTLKEIEGLMRAKRNTSGGDRLDALVALVEKREARHCGPRPRFSVGSQSPRMD
jgi:hypothetical protein